MAGISDRAMNFGSPNNKHLFNGGNELQSGEFGDGTNLNWYDAEHRMYDPQIGRFFQIDKLAELSINFSPYVFASDNPVSLNDPLGLNDSIENAIVNPPDVTVTATRLGSQLNKYGAEGIQA